MTVLVGYVPAPLGEAALTAAIAESRWRREDLLVVNMARDDVLVDARRAPSADLDRVRREVAESGLDAEVLQVDEGEDPAAVLVSLATQRQASVVVIGLRQRTAVGKLILGSNAHRILTDAPCQVLAVKLSTG